MRINLGSSASQWRAVIKIGKNMRNLITGIFMGAIVSAALLGPALVSVERATPSGFNVFWGDTGFHFAGVAQ